MRQIVEIFGGKAYRVIEDDGSDWFAAENNGKLAEVQAYLVSHPEALQPEPTPPAPTPEQLKEREIAEKLAYLASTDWYVIRYADSGVPVPDDIKAARAAARLRIDELKA